MRPGARWPVETQPLPRKLGIKPGARLGLIGAPDGFATTLGELPAEDVLLAPVEWLAERLAAG